ncbi:hypothetical protein HOL21_04700 [Candidatus Woesearchaeota archaeon]|jgi:hypothetical protein|nr:hypothetical protein [Candidatus Woesearchaeota archaeon]MBT5397486.1 hypothetical protein [Candidatus Woesearchaeota archaeon]MBT5924615.1 hypothetical protein [Candidatus Woesearchaeota archaeon]MBT6367941.1 hypothetical protein [Candidatus Woesearchaeota archaeon]MBT7763165.1 hypothetical protein [Candidatus Woesearchaeota archaeon]
MEQQPVQQDSAFDPAKLYVWVKSLEGKVNNLLRELDVLKNDFVRKNLSLTKELKVLSDDVLEFKRSQDQSLQKMDIIIKELKMTAGYEEVQVLKKYVDLWSPMNFVTQRDLERAIDARLHITKQKK